MSKRQLGKIATGKALSKQGDLIFTRLERALAGERGCNEVLSLVHVMWVATLLRKPLL
jgi:hypothetical protein